MPYQSLAQSAFLHINHPDIAKKWDAEGYKSKGLPEYKKQSLSEHMSNKLKEKKNG